MGSPDNSFQAKTGQILADGWNSTLVTQTRLEINIKVLKVNPKTARCRWSTH